MNKTILAIALVFAMIPGYAAAQWADESTMESTENLERYGASGSEFTGEQMPMENWEDQTEAYGPGGSEDYGSMGSGMSAESANSSDKDLFGAVVKNPQGDDLGVIIDVVKDSEGRDLFAILIYGDHEQYGDMGKQVAIPFSALSCEAEDCTLSASKETLESAPTFSSKDDLASSDRTLAGDIYRHFGVQPYWSDEGFRSDEGFQSDERFRSEDEFNSEDQFRSEDRATEEDIMLP